MVENIFASIYSITKAFRADIRRPLNLTKRSRRVKNVKNSKVKTVFFQLKNHKFTHLFIF